MKFRHLSDEIPMAEPKSERASMNEEKHMHHILIRYVHFL